MPFEPGDWVEKCVYSMSKENYEYCECKLKSVRHLRKGVKTIFAYLQNLSQKNCKCFVGKLFIYNFTFIVNTKIKICMPLKWKFAFYSLSIISKSFITFLHFFRAFHIEYIYSCIIVLVLYNCIKECFIVLLSFEEI